MKRYDVVVVGSGSGMLIVDEAVEHGLKVALVDSGPLGGTCLNTGCIPSKMLIYPADRLVEIRQSQKLGITAGVRGVDFRAIMQRMRQSIKASQEHLRQTVTQAKTLDFYEGEARFVGEYAIEVNGQQIEGESIFLASGSRTFIPPLTGLDGVDYLTNESVLQLDEPPQSLIIIGGGYIGVEYGHFFAAMGTRVTILEMMEHLVPVEEPEIYGLLERQLSQRMEVHTSTRAGEIRQEPDGVSVTVTGGDGKEKQLRAQRLMVAVGRRSNADRLVVERGGIETDKRGFIKTDGLLQTNMQNIFAVGDANGKFMFTHVANREALVAANNFFRGTGLEMDYSTIPHAVYTHPQIAAVGLTEEQARKDFEVSVATVKYFDVAKGEAMVEREGFAKAIAERGSERLLGFHIIGPCAPLLIQEVVNAMTSGGHTAQINEGLHIHPALSELIQNTVNSFQ